MFTTPLKFLLPLIALLGTAPSLRAAELDFYRDVFPFLKANCISCHNKTTTKADLDMESPAVMKKGGESGPAIIPGKSADSLIVQASLHQNDMEMPPANNKSGAVDLTAAEIQILKTWIDQGAKDSIRQEREVAWQPLAKGVHPIYSVAMTHDGRYAACGRSNQIFIYDLATRQFATQIVDDKAGTGTAHRALVQSLAFSPDGTRLASGSFREVKIWRQEITQVPTPTKTAPALIPETKASDAQLKKIADAGKIGILSHTLSPDGKQIALGCADGSVRVWDLAANKPLIELWGNVAAARQMAELDWTIAAQVLEQAFQKTVTARIEAQNKAVDELLKKANETITTMKKVLPEKQKPIKPAQEAKSAAQKAVDAIEADLAKAADGKADAAQQKQLKEAQDKLASATMAETSALAAYAAVESNIADAQEDVTRITATKARNSKDLAATTTLIAKAKAAQDKAAADLSSAKQAQRKNAAKPLSVAFSADAQQVAAILSDGTLNVWAVTSGTAIEQVKGPALPAATLTYDGASKIFTASNATATHPPVRWVLEKTLGGDKDSAVFADRVNALRFSPDGQTLATGGGEPSRSGDIILFDAGTGKVVKNWKEKHEDAVLSLDFSPDGKLLASGAADKIARVTDIATGKQVNLFEGHTHHVTGVAFRADGRVLATAGADGVVIAWDVILGERKKKIEGWSKEVTAVQFIGASNQMVTSAGDNLVRIINDDGGEVRSIAKLPDFMQSVASTPNGTTVIAGGEDSVLRVWDGTTGKELVLFGSVK